MKAYVVCFVPWKKQHIDSEKFFSAKENAIKYIDEVFTRFSKHHKVTLDKEHPNYICRIYLENFYMDPSFKDSYDSYYIEEIEIH